MSCMYSYGPQGSHQNESSSFCFKHVLFIINLWASDESCCNKWIISSAVLRSNASECCHISFNVYNVFGRSYEYFSVPPVFIPQRTLLKRLRVSVNLKEKSSYPSSLQLECSNLQSHDNTFSTASECRACCVFIDWRDAFHGNLLHCKFFIFLTSWNLPRWLSETIFMHQMI